MADPIPVDLTGPGAVVNAIGAAALIPGPPGPPGSGKDGSSAYEVAVANGFEGGEDEWLDSLALHLPLEEGGPRNIFSGAYTTGMILAGGGLAQLRTIANYAPYEGRTAVVAIEAGKTYTVKVHDPALSNVFRIGIWDSAPLFESEADWADHPVLYDDDAEQHTFTNTSTGRYVAIYVSNSGGEPRLQVEEGEVATEYGQSGEAKLAPAALPTITAQMLAPSAQDMGGRYHYYEPIPTSTYAAPAVPDLSPALLDSEQPADVYALYDAIAVAGDVGTISTRTLGHSQLADGTADDSLPIIEYRYAPHRADSITSVRVPRLLIQAGIHGYEKGAVHSTYEWFEGVMTGTDEKSVWLRNHIDIHLVPVANPYSYANNIRHNVNGVDVNTNFTSDWYYVQPGSSLYSGEEPMSEMETRVLDSWYSEFAHDAIGLLDVHNNGVRELTTGPYGLCWWISPDEHARSMAWQAAGSLSRKWREDFPELGALPAEVVFSDVSARVAGVARNQSFKAHGIRSLTIDASWAFPDLVTGASKYSQPTIQTATDALGAAVLGFVRNFGG